MHNEPFKVIGGIISAVISMVALFIKILSIVLQVPSVLSIAMGPCCRLCSIETDRVHQSVGQWKFGKIHFDLLSGYDTLFVFRVSLFKRKSGRKIGWSVGDIVTHLKSMAKVAVSGVIGNVFRPNFQYSSLTGYWLILAKWVSGSSSSSNGTK